MQQIIVLAMFFAFLFLLSVMVAYTLVLLMVRPPKSKRGAK